MTVGTVPCSECKSDIQVTGPGSKGVQAHRLTYVRQNDPDDTDRHICAYTTFCSRECGQKYLNA